MEISMTFEECVWKEYEESDVVIWDLHIDVSGIRERK
jgi:hypothetical protein